MNLSNRMSLAAAAFVSVSLASMSVAQWSAPENLGPDVNSSMDELGPFVFEDRLYFSSTRPGGFGGYDLYASLRAGDAWAPPENLFSLNTEVNERAPSVACVDGHGRMVFGSDRAGNYDVWGSTNLLPCPVTPPPDWDAPSILSVNSADYESMPTISPDGSMLLFGSDRGGGLGGYDIWVSYDDGAGWSPPVNLGPVVNTPANEGGPSLSDDGQTLYFSSNRPGGFGGIDLYRSVRVGGEWTTPENLGPDINTESHETCPQETGDGLYFRSTRPGGFGEGDLYVSRRLAPTTCPDDSLFSQPPTGPDEFWTAGTSDAAAGMRRYENYHVDGDVCDVHWWGLMARFTDEGWVACYEEPMVFDIAFHFDADGQPGDIACEYTYAVTGVPTGLDYQGLPLYHFAVDLDPCCPLTHGWISIQAIEPVSTVDPDCWFLWMSSEVGDGLSWFERESPPTWQAEGYDLSLCLTPAPPRPMFLDGPDFYPYERVVDPRGPWHELWPEFCTTWGCFEWIDNGTGVLDPCDYLHLEGPLEASWWHVERVTFTVVLEVPGAPPFYLEWLGPFSYEPFDPIGDWHEVYPSFCTPWRCVGWQDTDGGGRVDPCDWLFFEFGGEFIELHVVEIATDIEVIRERPPCPWDITGDDLVGFDDLLQVLSNWGPCSVDPCPADIDGDHIVGFSDLLEVLSHWGPCP